MTNEANGLQRLTLSTSRQRYTTSTIFFKINLQNLLSKHHRLHRDPNSTADDLLYLKRPITPVIASHIPPPRDNNPASPHQLPLFIRLFTLFSCAAAQHLLFYLLSLSLTKVLITFFTIHPRSLNHLHTLDLYL
jgi:hypothetical protein